MFLPYGVVLCLLDLLVTDLSCLSISAVFKKKMSFKYVCSACFFVVDTFTKFKTRLDFSLCLRLVFVFVVLYLRKASDPLLFLTHSLSYDLLTLLLMYNCCEPVPSTQLYGISYPCFEHSSNTSTCIGV